MKGTNGAYFLRAMRDVNDYFFSPLDAVQCYRAPKMITNTKDSISRGTVWLTVNLIMSFTNENLIRDCD